MNIIDLHLQTLNMNAIEKLEINYICPKLNAID